MVGGLYAALKLIRDASSQDLLLVELVDDPVIIESFRICKLENINYILTYR